MESNFCAVWFLLLLKVAIFPVATKAVNSKAESITVEANGEKSTMLRPELKEQEQKVQKFPIKIGDHVIFPGNSVKIYKDSKKRSAIGGHKFETYGVLAREWKVIPVGTKSRVKKSSTMNENSAQSTASSANMTEKINKRSKFNLRNNLRKTANYGNAARSARTVAQVIKKRSHDASKIKGTRTLSADNRDSWESAHFRNQGSALDQLQPVESIDSVASCANSKGGTGSSKMCADMHKKAMIVADVKVDALKKELQRIAADNAREFVRGDRSADTITNVKVSPNSINREV
ncbi:uncharacterized protein LOC124155851 [Ischnura elegans]|uniref:uncharacterized protein LOC124155851 n=1 Tax=Ischnura elegans TaxID=197161 RepID=UPI001ED89F2D|nr:uncharacterized protein LOC124155851 [Ischnura elegans]